MENLWRYYISTDVFDTGGVVYASDESVAISKILRYYNDERMGTITIGVGYDGNNHKKGSKWAEITNHYFDEERQCYTIDAWVTDNDCEEGKVIARVFVNSELGTVYYDEDAKTDSYAQEIIQETISILESQ